MHVWVCVAVCLVCWCVYLFMNRVFVCTVPLFRRKIRRHLLGDSELAVKNWKESVVVEGKKKARQPRDISILAPRFPQAAGRRLQNGSTPRHRVGSALSKRLWMENTDWKVSSFLSLFPRCFSSSPPFCPSFIAHRKGHLILSSEALIECCLCAEKNTLLSLSLSHSHFLSLAGASPELSVSVRYLPVTQKSILH